MVRAVVFVVFAVALLLPRGPASAAPVRDLAAWGGGWQTVGMSAVRQHGPLLKSLAPGTYRIRVRAMDDMPFRLYGPGVDRRTKGPQGYYRSYTVHETWMVTLKRGIYRYRVVGQWAEALRENGIQIERSFLVR
jgi:hypothetical protein